MQLTVHTCTVDQNKSNDEFLLEDRAGIPQVIVKGPCKDVPTSLEPHESRRDKVSDAVLDKQLILNCEAMRGSFQQFECYGKVGNGIVWWWNVLVLKPRTLISRMYMVRMSRIGPSH